VIEDISTNTLSNNRILIFDYNDYHIAVPVVEVPTLIPAKSLTGFTRQGF
jgi:hypothetical protein